MAKLKKEESKKPEIKEENKESKKEFSKDFVLKTPAAPVLKSRGESVKYLGGCYKVMVLFNGRHYYGDLATEVCKLTVGNTYKINSVVAEDEFYYILKNDENTDIKLSYKFFS